MTATIHRTFMTLAGICAGVGGLMAGTETAPLGIPPEAGAWLAFAAGALTIVATSIRANWPSDIPTPPTTPSSGG